MTLQGKSLRKNDWKFCPRCRFENAFVEGLGQGGNYRRTGTGKGRTKKPGRQGTVKNPCLLQLSTMASEAFNMELFFIIAFQ
jgi:hypothetical protein